MNAVVGFIVLAGIVFLVVKVRQRMQANPGLQRHKAQRTHGKGVRAAEKALAEAGKQQSLGVFAGIRLFDTEIKIGKKTYPVTPSLSASVDAAGNVAVKSRSSLTRMGAGTLVAGPIGLIAGASAKKNKKIDARELYLLIESDTWAETIKVNPDKGTGARSFAQKINLAARQVEQITAARAVALAECEQQLSEALQTDSTNP